MDETTTPMRQFYDRNLNMVLTLPGDWQVYPNDDAAVAYIGPAVDNYYPTIVVRLARQVADDPEAYRTLADLTARAFEEVESESTEGEIAVDSFPAIFRIYRWRDPDSGTEAVQEQLFIQTSTVTVLYLTFNLTDTLADTYLPIFAQVIESIRFLLALPATWADVVPYTSAQA